MLDKQIKKNDNFCRLSLSPSKKPSDLNSSQNGNSSENFSPNNVLNMSPEKKPTLNVKNLSQLIIQNSANKPSVNGNAIDSSIKIKCNIVSNANIDKEIITLSSDEEEIQIENKSKRKKRKLKKKPKLETPEKKEDIKIEEKPTTKRKLTKSTNLKTFSAKDHPDNQTKLEIYFTITPNPKSIKYFDTFENSSKPKNDEKETNTVLDGLESIMDDVDNGAAISLKLSESIVIENTTDRKLFGSESVNTHFQIKKKNGNNSKNLNKVGNKLQNNSILPEKMKKELLKKGSNTRSKNSLDAKTIATTNIYNLDLDYESRNDSSESVVFNYNSSPSIKTESVIYSLAESAIVCRNSKRLNSESTLTTTNNSEELLPQKKVRKRLFQNSTRINNDVSTNEDIESSCTIVTLPNLIIPRVQQSCAISKNTHSTVSKHPSNSACSFEQYKYNSHNYPIIIEDDGCEYLPPIQLDKLSKSTSKLKTKIRATTTKRKNLNNKRNRIPQCPSYKVIEDTTFAVDGFRFGVIEGVTHYFLTHFHGDHYIGLRKNFSMPIYMSEITATLVSSFIHVNSDFLHIINPNETKTINGIEVTAIDANHCPGAVMFAFKLPNGKCILHTGDFRASPEMESEPYFWNNDIDAIYLDTTYLHKNYDFKPQSESISDVRYYLEQFSEKHIGQRILFVCGSYVIGKEKVWAEIAEVTKHRVYTNGNRRKALTAIGDSDLLKHLIDDPRKANIHVVTMNEVNYLKLYDYFKLYSDYFDLVLGIRPSGWEKNTKPQFSGIINVLGIEYSEHSSYSELRRFCRFLQPKSIISTVPVNNNDLSTTAKIPKTWFNNNVQARQQAYQPSICSYISTTAKNRYIDTDDQQPTCSKYLKQNDHCSAIGMLDATKSSLDMNSPAKSKLAKTFDRKEFKDVKSIDRLSSEPLDDWML